MQRCFNFLNLKHPDNPIFLSVHIVKDFRTDIGRGCFDFSLQSLNRERYGMTF